MWLVATFAVTHAARIVVHHLIVVICVHRSDILLAEALLANFLLRE